MNKKIKKIIAITLTVSAFCAITPATNLNLMTTKAYASSDNADELTEINLETSGGSDIDLYEDSDYEDDLDEVKEGKVYYAETSADKVKIITSGTDSDNVRIFKGATKYEEGKSIPISAGGTTTLKIRAYDDKYDSDESYTEDDYNEYTIRVKSTSSSSNSNSEDNQDAIYLSDLTLSEGTIDFRKTDSSYDINVDESVNQITIKAKPENDYTVQIDGTTVSNDGDNYRKTIDLENGENTIKIKIEDDDDNARTYTLNITRGTSTSTSAATTTSATNTTTTTNNSDTTNKWVSSNGKWVYNDALGYPLKNVWFFDKNYGKTFYLQADGTMATGWLNKDDSWYYLDATGAKQTGWQSISGNWYYLDAGGKMKTGWFQDTDKNWYYLQSSGIMAKDTTIDGCQLGSDGVWTK